MRCGGGQGLVCEWSLSGSRVCWEGSGIAQRSYTLLGCLPKEAEFSLARVDGFQHEFLQGLSGCLCQGGTWWCTEVKGVKPWITVQEDMLCRCMEDIAICRWVSGLVSLICRYVSKILFMSCLIADKRMIYLGTLNGSTPTLWDIVQLGWPVRQITSLKNTE